ncbi:hypothetical protein R1sor_024828 [Riccia sorocarpa]|uniref:Uncharacterized protein n=1 Tax=Riccia sorocarpa TaxID=122646 RepID=A0ABD3GRK1_9MARC
MSQREVLYSCGQCGYPLKLCSSDRAILGVGAAYLKENKKGKICFLNFDESRFRLQDEMKCGLYYHSKTTWKLHRVRTKLYCGQCEAFIGYVSGDGVHSSDERREFDFRDNSDHKGQKRFWVNIRALQPDQETESIPSKLDPDADPSYGRIRLCHGRSDCDVMIDLRDGRRSLVEAYTGQWCKSYGSLDSEQVLQAEAAHMVLTRGESVWGGSILGALAHIDPDARFAPRRLSALSLLPWKIV